MQCLQFNASDFLKNETTMWLNLFFLKFTVKCHVQDSAVIRAETSNQINCDKSIIEKKIILKSNQ